MSGIFWTQTELSVKLRMGADVHKNDIVMLFPKDCPQIAANVDASAAGESRIYSVIPEQGMESAFRKQFQAFKKGKF